MVPVVRLPVVVMLTAPPSCPARLVLIVLPAEVKLVELLVKLFALTLLPTVTRLPVAMLMLFRRLV